MKNEFLFINILLLITYLCGCNRNIKVDKKEEPVLYDTGSSNKKNNYDFNHQVNDKSETINHDIDSSVYIVYLDSLRLFYKSKSEQFKELIIRDFQKETRQMTYFEEYLPDSDLLEYAKNAFDNGDLESYDLLTYEMEVYNNLNYLPLALIFADKYDYSQAYRDIFHFYLAKNSKAYDLILLQETIEKPTREEYNYAKEGIDYIHKDEQMLALFALFEGARKGNMSLKRYLSNYFSQGRYVKKDINTAIYLNPDLIIK